MRVFFKEKPTAEAVSRYEEKLNHLLQYLKATVKIKLLDEPFRIESYVNGQHTETDYHWIDEVEATTPEIKVESSLFSQSTGHAGEFFDEKFAWADAFHIQSDIYKALKRNPDSPLHSNDPYWKLWDFLDK